ncbi:hypothetical protein Apa02nite_039390 [Actinoplanes palleronii]|uniref:Uncharacterized protein n=1 Tax=Actinoplanes palleronii TaxID=113570 RepID=A0ABQ4BAU5_9ACTN|nr:hypothetical protein Apa02nite_039390 [Actinoplanes palleronii]
MRCAPKVPTQAPPPLPRRPPAPGCARPRPALASRLRLPARGLRLRHRVRLRRGGVEVKVSNKNYQPRRFLDS